MSPPSRKKARAHHGEHDPSSDEGSPVFRGVPKRGHHPMRIYRRALPAFLLCVPILLVACLNSNANGGKGRAPISPPQPNVVIGLTPPPTVTPLTKYPLT